MERGRALQRKGERRSSCDTLHCTTMYCMHQCVLHASECSPLCCVCPTRAGGSRTRTPRPHPWRLVPGDGERRGRDGVSEAGHVM